VTDRERQRLADIQAMTRDELLARLPSSGMPTSASGPLWLPGLGRFRGIAVE
jgi:hypothetical protein